MKKRFMLWGEYSGLKGYRLSEVGGLVLYRIMNDPPVYWKILIKGFDPKKHVAPDLIDPDKIPVWTFQRLEEAEAKFLALSQLPVFVAKEESAKKSRIAAKQHMLDVRIPLPVRAI